MHALLALALLSPATPAPEVTLERLMAAPEWMGRFAENPRWTADGETILFDRKVEGCEERELVALSPEDGTQRVVPDERLGRLDAWGGALGPAGRVLASVRAGDVFVTDLVTLESRQLTRTAEAESAPQVMADERSVAFQRGNVVFVRDLITGLERQAADVRSEDEPGKLAEEGALLRADQERLFDHVRDAQATRDAALQRERELAFADPTRPPFPFRIGKDVRVRSSHLSPSGRFMLVVAGGKDQEDWKDALMPEWVTASGQVETREVHPKVGSGAFESPRLVLLDLVAGTQRDLDLAPLPGIADDPLEDLRRRAEERAKARQPKAPDAREEPKQKKKPEAASPRPVTFGRAEWSADGERLVVQVHSADFKDRWLAEVDLDAGRLVPVHRLHDEAWVSWSGNDMGFVPGTRDLWFLSEETGWSQLYVHAPGDKAPRRLTHGRQVVEDPEPSRDGRWIWFTANPGNPGVREAWRVELATSASEQVTHLRGMNRVKLSPDGTRLLIRHSEATRPPELYVQDAWPGGVARQLTDSRSEAFRAITWTAPRFVDVPSRHGAGTIRARLYLPEGPAPDGGRPAVFFIHGAGYLQDAHEGWSDYFREFMFATLLTRAGYVVMDADYRASAGYGRAWRTAIHRNMGAPELDDLDDCAAWLAATQGVDPKRVGAWGGSYGGFLVLQSLFTRPGALACGAALRPVTDWAHYHHSYTARILETPELAPEAYRSSSPIWHAAGLSRPLLICSPMLDDNVFFQDSVRLTQRLIELEKQDWQIAIYPVEPHTFVEPASWLDEYRRIRKLFRDVLGL